MESTYASYDYVEAYDATVGLWEKQLRKLRFPVAKLGEPTEETFRALYSQNYSTYQAIFHVRLNRKDDADAYLQIRTNLRVDNYASSKSECHLDIEVERVALRKEKEVADFITLFKRAGRTRADVMAFLDTVEETR